MLFCRAEWAREGWLVSRVLGVDLGEILRASGRLLAVSFTMRRRGREEAPISGGRRFILWGAPAANF